MEQESGGPVGGSGSGTGTGTGVGAAEKFKMVLRQLSLSKESIQSATKILLDNVNESEDLFHMLMKRLKKMSAKRRLPLFYLVDSVCQVSRSKQQTEYRDIASRHLMDIIVLVVPDEGEARIKAFPAVQKVLGLWKERKVFAPDLLKRVRRKIQPVEKVEDPNIKRDRSFCVGMSTEDALKYIEEWRRNHKRKRWESALRPVNDKPNAEFEEEWIRFEQSENKQRTGEPMFFEHDHKRSPARKGPYPPSNYVPDPTELGNTNFVLNENGEVVYTEQQLYGSQPEVMIPENSLNYSHEVYPVEGQQDVKLHYGVDGTMDMDTSHQLQQQQMHGNRLINPMVAPLLQAPQPNQPPQVFHNHQQSPTRHSPATPTSSTPQQQQQQQFYPNHFQQSGEFSEVPDASLNNSNGMAMNNSNGMMAMSSSGIGMMDPQMMGDGSGMGMNPMMMIPMGMDAMGNPIPMMPVGGMMENGEYPPAWVDAAGNQYTYDMEGNMLMNGMNMGMNMMGMNGMMMGNMYNNGMMMGNMGMMNGMGMNGMMMNNMGGMNPMMMNQMMMNGMGMNPMMMNGMNMGGMGMNPMMMGNMGMNNMMGNNNMYNKYYNQDGSYNGNYPESDPQQQPPPPQQQQQPPPPADDASSSSLSNSSSSTKPPPPPSAKASPSKPAAKAAPKPPSAPGKPSPSSLKKVAPSPGKPPVQKLKGPPSTPSTPTTPSAPSTPAEDDSSAPSPSPQSSPRQSPQSSPQITPRPSKPAAKLPPKAPVIPVPIPSSKPPAPKPKTPAKTPTQKSPQLKPLPPNHPTPQELKQSPQVSPPAQDGHSLSAEPSATHPADVSAPSPTLSALTPPSSPPSASLALPPVDHQRQEMTGLT